MTVIPSFSRWIPALVLVLVLAPAAVAGEGEDPDPGGSGFDLRQPAQAAFQGWPPRELLRKAYWMPWDVRSFLRARIFQRPVLFVMGVDWSLQSREMKADLLGDPEILETVNQRYISIYVDADRRPDIRLRYQTGNWPVVAFLLPDGNPMISSANEDRVERPITVGRVDREAMTFLLEQGSIYFDGWKNDLFRKGAEWAAHEEPDPPLAGKISEEASDLLSLWLQANLDPVHGGIGLAPKRLVPGFTEYALLRASRAQTDLRDASRDSLLKIIGSPLHDDEGGGIHRVAVAPAYGDVKREKMLDRNASWVRELVFAVRDQDSPEMREALRGACRFLIRGLGRSGGGFHNSWWPASDAGPSEVDELVLSGPNAMAGAALIRAGVLLGDREISRAGRAAMDLVVESAWEKARGARHVIEPDPGEQRFLATQADTAFHLMDAYDSTGNRRYLEAARDIAGFSTRNLLAGADTAMYDTLPERWIIGLMKNPRRPIRENARMARALLRLGLHERNSEDLAQARNLVGTFAGDLSRYGVHGTESALAVEEAIRHPLVVRLEGDEDAVAGLRREALNLSHPWTILMTPGPEEIVEPGARAILIFGSRTEIVSDPDEMEAVAADILSQLPSGTES